MTSGGTSRQRERAGRGFGGADIYVWKPPPPSAKTRLRRAASVPFCAVFGHDARAVRIKFGPNRESMSAPVICVRCDRDTGMTIPVIPYPEESA